MFNYVKKYAQKIISKLCLVSNIWKKGNQIILKNIYMEKKNACSGINNVWCMDTWWLAMTYYKVMTDVAFTDEQLQMNYSIKKEMVWTGHSDWCFRVHTSLLLLY